MITTVPDILYGKGNYRRDNGNFTELKLVNMFAEVSPTVEQGVAILSREGLASVATRGAGPINAIFQRPGLFSGDVFSLSGNALYRGATLIGAITGTGPVSIASSDIELVITRGATAYSYNGTNLQAIAFPDSANVRAVTFIGGLFIYARDGTHQFYWSEVLDGRTVGALSFASAESLPDALLDVVAIGDNLYLLGEESLEVHYLTGEANLPFTRISQRTVRKGVIETGCAIEVDNALHFIGADKIIYRMADVPQRISDHSLEERVEASTTHSCFTFIYQGHTFFCVRLDDGTWLTDPSIPGQWPKFESWGEDNWIAGCAVNLETGPQFGSAVGNDLLEFSGWQDDGTALVRTFTAAFPIKGGVVPVDMLELECNAGAPSGVASPQIEMRSSRNGGDTFSNWRTAPLGAQGEYRKRPRFRRCGYFDAPGALFEFRCSDAVPLRVSAVLANEPAGGRGRS